MTERAVVIGRDGRAKAYRPLPEAERAAAIRAGLAAYERGDYFEAHEDLEPAWMGTDDVAERALLQGLIKVAAAYVHDVRGNPTGIVRNLQGARVLLLEASSGGPGRNAADIDIGALIAAIDLRLGDLAAHPDDPTLPPPALTRHAVPTVRPPRSVP
jgi:predicted metal-dependent hydrolase